MYWPGMGVLIEEKSDRSRMRDVTLVTIKEVAEEDLDHLAILLEELTQSPTERTRMRENFCFMEENDDYIVLGAYDGGKLVGSLMGIVCRDLAGAGDPFLVIENVIVSSACRGRGVGRELMLAIEAFGRRRCCAYAMFVSGSQRKAAHKFYESMGYRLDQVQGFKKFL